MLKIYNEYQKHGIDEYYKNYSTQYVNPHEEKIKSIYLKYIYNELIDNKLILDIACGSGLISQIISEFNTNLIVKGCDPYFNNKYCHYDYSFEDIVQGKLEESYDVGICCYAYHLMKYELQYDFLTNIAYSLKKFIIISPSKKIIINHPLWKIINSIRQDKITVIILEKLIF
jgi:2-polyprenyl-3-methyl-5-hydroxy-6-metoxy-1,4-benzoquinol methylase